MADDESSLAKKPRIDSEGNGTTIVSSSTQDTLVRDDGEKLNDLLGEADKALQESNRRHIKPVVDENKLGIQLFVGDVKDQYHGLIKARYADFIVHEIDLEGNMAKLDNLEAPVDDNELSSNAMKLEDLFDRKVLVHLSNVNNGTLDTYKIDVTGMDKDMRTSIHNAIKASYDKLDSSTVSDSDQTNRLSRNAKNGVKDNSQDTKEPDSTSHRADGDPNSSKALNNDEEQPAESAGAPAKQGGDEEEKKYILVARRNKASRPRSIWPQDRPDFTHFVLYKENKDTMDAIHNLALATHSKPAHFTYAGTKDRRAVTSQWVSSWRLDPKRLISSMRRFNKRPFIKVGNFCYKKNAIGLGQLRANKFDIVIRHLVHNKRGEKVIEDAMNYVKENGFVNYFGLQRFGTRSVLTHEVGLAILQGKWSQAVDLILSYRYDDTTQPLPNAPDANSNPTTPSGQPESTIEQSNKPPQQQQRNQNQNQKRWASGAEQHNASIDLWKSKQDADLVFKKYPHFRMTNEGLIIRALSRSEESRHDHAAAIVSLPRNTRSMYVHSYQSLLWNKLATLRLKNHGFKVTPGDLILSPEASISDNSLDNMLAVDGADTPEDGSLITGEQPDRAQEIGKTGERKLPVEEIDASIVIASEENLHKYSIFDVVMPLVGSKTKIPANESGKELERLLAEDGLTLESFRARERMFVSYGSYRKIMVKPANLEWSIKQYSHPYENLVGTDLDKLNAADEKVPSDSRPSAPVKSDSSDEALIVSFELPPSSYATMCLRELMKKPSTDFDNRF